MASCADPLRGTAYRAKWGLAKDYPMVAPNYAAARSKPAKQIGLGQGGGVGHNLPQEAPQAFAQAVLDVDHA